MDKQEYNNNHAETRRCCSLEHLDLGNNLLPAPDSMQDDLDEQVLWNRICKRLTTREQLIGNAYYRQGFTQEELAKHFHISQQRVASILSAIRRKARKFVKL
jgi:RNA polymerase sigma factor (sigma-70 family)